MVRLITRNPLKGLEIGLAEVIKMLLYDAPKGLGLVRARITGNGESKKIHIAKTIFWRIIGTIDTIVLAWIISGDPIVGLKVGGAELITRMILYYLQVRGWYVIDFGIKKRPKAYLTATVGR